MIFIGLTGAYTVYEDASEKPRVFQQIVGMTVEEFNKLKPAFEQAYAEAQAGKPSRAGRKSVLRTIEDKMFFILFYFRHYPIQEVIAFLFGFCQGQANHWIHRLSPILQAALGSEGCLPERSAKELREILAACEVPEFLIDGSERPIRRSGDNAKQRQDYSGKKKRHCKKNIVVTERSSGEVLGLGRTQVGSKHDKACVEEEQYTFPEGSRLFQDTGFQGYAPEGVSIEQPTKKPRGGDLSPEQKARNGDISKKRVAVEHTLAGVKIFHIVSDVFRNFKEGFDDLVISTACGLFNFVRSFRRHLFPFGLSSQLC
jgi:DDE superfamily endonuclease/Helix-turn-helix of DDE superfamily endonuclease